MDETRPLALIVLTMLIRPLAWVIAQLPATIDTSYIAYSLFFLTFLPEFGLFFPGFRKWIKGGVEDGDEKLNTKDLEKLLTFYSTILCIRVFVCSFVARVFLGKEVPDIYVYLSLAGGFGIQTLHHILKRKE